MEKDLRSGGIYQWKNLVNNKIYIGSTINFDNRKTSHKNALKNNRHGNKHLQRAWNLYGEDKFIFETLEKVPKHDKENLKDFKSRLVNEREQYYLNTLLFANFNDNRFRELEYNINRKANSPLGLKFSIET